YLEQALPHHLDALKPNPKHPTYRRFLRNHYMILANTLVRDKKPAGAAKAVAELVNYGPNSWQEYRDAASVLARCVPLAGDSPLAQQCTAKAIELLEEAFRKDFVKDAESLKKVPEFHTLASQPGFKKLVADLEEKMKDKPK